jgi:hypothetical protein
LIKTASRARLLRVLEVVSATSFWFDIIGLVYPAELPSAKCRLLAAMLQLKMRILASTLMCAPPHRWNREKHLSGRALT